MSIRAPKSKRKFTGKVCASCFMSYRTRYEHHTVLKCKEWDNKIVSETETCEKHCTRTINERDRED